MYSLKAFVGINKDKPLFHYRELFYFYKSRKLKENDF